MKNQKEMWKTQKKLGKRKTNLKINEKTWKEKFEPVKEKILKTSVLKEEIWKKYENETYTNLVFEINGLELSHNIS